MYQRTIQPSLPQAVPSRWLAHRERRALDGLGEVLSGSGAEEARAVMLDAWRAEHGREPSAAELLYSLGVAKLETSWGRGWKGAMVGSNNWGAVQCGKGVDQSTCIEYEDSHSDGTKYKVGFRSYPTPVEGARDVVRHLTRHRPLTWAVMRRPIESATINDFARAMREERYYGGFCPQATKAYGKAVIHYGKPPEGDRAKAECHEEAIKGYVRYMRGVLQSFAPEIGLSVPPDGETRPMGGGGFLRRLWGAWVALFEGKAS